MKVPDTLPLAQKLVAVKTPRRTTTAIRSKQAKARTEASSVSEGFAYFATA
jgi:hypothetical protein